VSRHARRGFSLAVVFFAFCAGMIVSWGLYHFGPPLPPGTEVQAGTAVQAGMDVTPPPSARVGSPDTAAKGNLAATPTVPIPTTGRISAPPLRMPLDNVGVEAMKGGFREKRGSRPHEAADLLAPRNTPVHAVEGGTIAKLFFSKAGGITIYQFDPGGYLIYYYAHLERYADGLHEGQTVSAGDVIGYVGTSGNAPPNTPHLHFAVIETDGSRQWWKGRAVDPYPLFRDRLKGTG
jgi:murein DD-endopeptidase MepM/ murein hydrolase activator NlpD